MRVGTWAFLTVLCLCNLLLIPEPGNAIFPLCLWRPVRSLDDVAHEAEETSLRPEGSARQPRVPLFMRGKDVCSVVCRNPNGINNLFCERCCPRRNSSVQQESTTAPMENQLALLLSLFLASKFTTTTSTTTQPTTIPASTRQPAGTSSSSSQTTLPIETTVPTTPSPSY